MPYISIGFFASFVAFSVLCACLAKLFSAGGLSTTILVFRRWLYSQVTHTMPKPVEFWIAVWRRSLKMSFELYFGISSWLKQVCELGSLWSSSPS